MASKIKIEISAEDKASAELKKTEKALGAFTEGTDKSRQAQDAFNAVAGATKVAIAATGVAAIAAAKASFDQVDAVQQATLGLRAYEKDGSKVNNVLKDLIGYARSDMGVLFNRKDLFASAQGLKLYGDNTDKLADHVKILSRSVGLGLSTWEGLNNVIGRVGSTGKLYADDLQYLQNAGFKLDGSLSGTTQSFDTLFALLDKGIPVDALEGQANTIKGQGVRMETAFRGIGDAILGVDKNTSQFIKGGLGDLFVRGMSNATTAMKEFGPTIASVSGFLTSVAVPAVSNLAAQVGDYLMPKLTSLWQSVQSNLMPALTSLWHNVLEPLIPVIGTALVVAVGAVLDGFKLMSDGIGFVVRGFQEGNPVVVGLAGVFGTLAAAMAFSAIFNALSVGFATLTMVTIPGAMASVGALGAMIAAPILMPAIAIGAALAAIASVLTAYNAMKSAIDQRDAAIRASLDVTKQMIERNARIQADGVSSTATKQRWQAAVDSAMAADRNIGRATGTVYAPGGRTLVGEHGPEYVDMPRGSSVTQAYRTRNEMNSGGGGVTNNLSGNFTFNNQESVDAFFNRLDETQRLAKMGMAA